MEELEQEEIQEEETDELDDLDSQLLEDEEEATIEIGGQAVKMSDLEKVYNDYSNDNNWQKTNTQKAQEIAAERQRLDEERQQFEQLRHDTELLLRQNQYQTPKMEQRDDPYYGMSQEEWEDSTPNEQRIIKNQYEQQKSWDNFLKQNEQKEFYNQTQSEHSRLKNIYSDYNSQFIERSILERSNNFLPQFEDIYLAETYKKILKGDPDAIKSMIPDTIKNEIQQNARKQLIEDLRKKDQQRKNLATVSPEKTALGKIPDSKPIGKQSYRDIRGDVLRTMNEEKITLFE